MSHSDESNRRRFLLTLFVLEHYMTFPSGAIPPGGWWAFYTRVPEGDPPPDFADIGKMRDQLHEIAGSPAIKDLDLIIAEGAHIFSTGILAQLN